MNLPSASKGAGPPKKRIPHLTDLAPLTPSITDDMAGGQGSEVVISVLSAARPCLEPIAKDPMEQNASSVRDVSNSSWSSSPLSPSSSFELFSIKIGNWTTVSITDELAGRVISTYLQRDHPLLSPFHCGLFVQNLVSSKPDLNPHCSPAMLNALMYWCCQMDGCIGIERTEIVEQFRIEALRTLDIELLSPRPTTMVAAMFLSLGNLAQGNSHAAVTHLSQAATIGTTLSLFGVPEHVGKESLAHLTTEEKTALAYPCWGVFNWITLMHLLFRQRGTEYPNYPPLLPIPNLKETSRGDEEHLQLERDPLEQRPSPSFSSDIFVSLSHFWRTFHKLNTGCNVETAPENRQDLLLQVAEVDISDLLRWTDRFATTIARFENNLGHATTLHSWLYSAVFEATGVLCKAQGKLQDALIAYKLALKGKEKAWGLEHDWTVDTVCDISLIHIEQEQLQEAEVLFKRALRAKEKGRGPDHTSTLETINNLGNLYMHQERLQDAEAMYKRALQGKENAWGMQHISTLNTVNNLGNCYVEQGRLRDAEVMYLRALQGKETACGREHESTLTTVHNLGLLYASQERLDDAEAMFTRVLQGSERVWGLEHKSTLDAFDNLGSIYMQQWRLQDAELMYKRALQGKERVWGLTNTSTLNTVHNLGLLHAKQRRLQDAEVMRHRALQGANERV